MYVVHILNILNAYDFPLILNSKK